LIKIAGEIIVDDNIINKYPQGSIERKIINKMLSSSATYRYDSLYQLEFELNLRKNIINAAIELHKSKFSFETFRESRCNTDYWTRTNEGGFQLKQGVLPSDAIRDIYINSSKYGTECATAMVIVFYKALLNIFPQKLFNTMFANIHLMNWAYIDRDLGIGLYRNEADYFPGDCRYFKNPDVNPKTPEWQGENVIDLGNSTYYGHGIGIGTADEIINALNKNRKAGATESAYLLNSATRPNFKYLADRYQKFISTLQREDYRMAWKYYRNRDMNPVYL
jgi:protein-glutamine gamma-glutamyltransferase